MNFRAAAQEEPEINLIPFIDVLLVVLIFLMLSTTYSKYTEVQLSLPTADAAQMKNRPTEVIVSVTADGAISINRQRVLSSDVTSLSAALTRASDEGTNTVVVISADASARHQVVISVMEAARRAGLNQVTFATQSSAGATQ